MDESMLRRSAAEEILSNDSVKGLNHNQMNASSMDEAFARLHEAEIKLKNIVMKKFDEAVRDDDVASVERFFKIFPLLNQHSEGLKKFSSYLCTKISEKALIKSTPNAPTVSHSDKLTQLYESIAKIIDIHQPLVETYYGPGKLVAVIEVLQKECDRLSKRIIDDFKTKKNLSQVVSLVTKSLKPSSSYQTITKVDPRDLDQLLSEIIVLNNRSETYLRFITKRSKNDIEVAFPQTSEDQSERLNKLNQIESIVRTCELSHLIHELIGVSQKHQNEKLESCLSDLVSLTGRFKSITTSGLGQLCSTVLKPRIKIWIDAFISSNHNLTDEDISTYEATDGLRPFMQTFIINIDALIKSLKESLTQNNSDTLLSLFSAELTQLGDAVLKCSYNKVSFFNYCSNFILNLFMKSIFNQKYFDFGQKIFELNL